MKKIISIILSTAILLMSVVLPVNAAITLDENFEEVDNIGSISGADKLIGSGSSTNTIESEDTAAGANQFLKVTGNKSAQFVTNSFLKAGRSKLSMRIQAKGGTHLLILRNGSGELLMMRIDGTNMWLLDQRSNPNAKYAYSEGDWFKFEAIIDTVSKNITATLLKDGDTADKTISCTVDYNVYGGGGYSHHVAENAHLRVKLDASNTGADGYVGIDDLSEKKAADAEFLQADKLLSVKPTLTFKSTSDTPLEAANIVLNGRNDLIDSVNNEGGGIYTATLKAPLTKNTAYTVSLAGYEDSNGLEANYTVKGFKTRNSGLTMSESGGVWTIKNELSDTETAVIAGAEFDGGKMKSFEFKRLSIAGGGTDTFEMSNADDIILMNSLSERIPYEVHNITSVTFDESTTEDLLELEPYDEATALVKGFGKSPNGDERAMIIAAIGPDADNVNLDTASEAEVKAAINYLHGVNTKASRYSFQFPTLGATGNYTISVRGHDANEAKTLQPMLLINPDDTSMLCAQIAAATTAQEVKAAVERYDYTLDINFVLLNNMTDKTFVYKYLLERAKTTPYTDAKGVSEDMRAAAVMYEINKADAPTALTLLNTYANEVGFDNAATKALWDALSAAQQLAVVEKCKDKQYVLVDEFINRVERFTIFTHISTNDRYGEVQEYIESYSHILGIAIDEYTALGRPSYIAKNMVGKLYDEASFVATFNKLLSDYKVSINYKEDDSSDGAIIIGKPTDTAPSSPLTPQEGQQQKFDFRDIATVLWAQQAVRALAKRYVVSGFPDGSFGPNLNVKREEFVTMLAKYFGLETAGAECEFSDVDKAAWYYPYVSAAYTSGVTKGVNDNRFGIGEDILRQDMAVMLLHMIEMTGRELPEGEAVEFADADEISDYAKDAVEKLSAAGILNGVDGSFMPNMPLTRAQAAVALYSVDGEGVVDENTVLPWQTKEAGLLKALGILDVEEKTEISRAAFAKAIVRLTTNSELKATDSELYSDVDSFTDGSGEIIYLSKENIITGFTDGTFRPNENIATLDAVAALCRALEYAEGELSEADIYTAAAKAGLRVPNSKRLSADEGVKLLWSALETRERRIDYTNRGKTILESVFEVKEGEGVIRATEISAVDSSSAARKGEVIIGGRSFLAQNLNDYLGYRMRFYYTENQNGDNTIIYAYPNKNDVLTVKARDIVSFTNGVFTYKVNEKIKKEDISASADMIYNGTAFPRYLDNDVQPSAGTVTLLDTGDGYNTIIVNEYVSGVVRNLTPDGDAIYFEGGAYLPIDTLDFITIEDTEGKQLTKDALLPGTIVSYLLDKTNTLLKLVVSEIEIKGTTTGMQLNEDKIFVDGDELYISPNMQLSERNNLSIGMDYLFKIDCCGEIITFEEDSARTDKLGYFIKVVDDELEKLVVVLTADNEILRLPLRDKVIVDGLTGVVGTDRMSVKKADFETTLTGTGSFAQLVQYRVNDDGYLTRVTLASNRNQYTSVVSDTKDEGGLYIDINNYKYVDGSGIPVTKNAAMFKADVNSFNGLCMVDDNTKIFSVSTDPNSYADSDNFSSGNIGLLVADESYQFISYRVGGNSVCSDAVVIFDYSALNAEIPRTSAISVITKVYDGINADMEPVTFVSVIRRGTELTLELSPDVTYNRLDRGTVSGITPSRGDTIRYLTDKKGRMSKIQFLYDCSAADVISGIETAPKDYGGAQEHLRADDIYDYQNGVLRLSPTPITNNIKWEDMIQYRVRDTVPIYLCEIGDNNATTVRMGTLDDIKSYKMVGTKCQKAVVFSRYGSPQAIVLYDYAA